MKKSGDMLLKGYFRRILGEIVKRKEEKCENAEKKEECSGII